MISDEELKAKIRRLAAAGNKAGDIVKQLRAYGVTVEQVQLVAQA